MREGRGFSLRYVLVWRSWRIKRVLIVCLVVCRSFLSGEGYFRIGR